MKVSLSGNAWVDAKSDDVIVLYVLGLPYTTGQANILLHKLSKIAIFRFTSGFSGNSGYRSGLKLPKGP